MPFSLLPLALASAAAASPPAACARPVAPDEAAARRIAEREISGRARTGLRWFSLNVVPDRDRPGHWFAYESPMPGLPSTGRAPPGVRGGGGLAMRINRCTGTVSDIHRQR